MGERRHATPLDAAGRWLDVAEGAIQRALECLAADEVELEAAASRAVLTRAMRLYTSRCEVRVEQSTRARLCGERGLDRGCRARLVGGGCAGACGA